MLDLRAVTSAVTQDSGKEDAAEEKPAHEQSAIVDPKPSEPAPPAEVPTILEESEVARPPVDEAPTQAQPAILERKGSLGGDSSNAKAKPGTAVMRRRRESRQISHHALIDPHHPSLSSLGAKKKLLRNNSFDAVNELVAMNACLVRPLPEDRSSFTQKGTMLYNKLYGKHRTHARRRYNSVPTFKVAEQMYYSGVGTEKSRSKGEKSSSPSRKGRESRTKRRKEGGRRGNRSEPRNSKARRSRSRSQTGGTQHGKRKIRRSVGAGRRSKSVIETERDREIYGLDGDEVDDILHSSDVDEEEDVGFDEDGSVGLGSEDEDFDDDMDDDDDDDGSDMMTPQMSDFEDQDALHHMLHKFFREENAPKNDDEQDDDSDSVKEGESSEAGAEKEDANDGEGKGTEAPRKRKTTFTLQDVVELTLLHAQQMQLLQNEYELRISDLTQRISEMEQRHTDTVTDYESRLQMINDRAQRLATEYKKAVQEAEEIQQRLTTSTSKANDADEGEEKHGKKGDGETEDEESEESEDGGNGKSSRRGSRKRSLKEVKNRSKHRSGYKDPRNARDKYAFRRRREFVLKNRPKFTGTQFAMTFLERLRWFMDGKLTRQKALQEKFTQIETAQNEERLAQWKLLNESKKVGQTNPEAIALPAEFMPAPGQVPAPPKRDIWLEHGNHGPWGGRFQLPPSKDRGQVNILNLFDVTMALNAVNRQPS
ncbi:hypothetical protein HK102_010804 [Quaeritorhiza haematococci]|nr:hypothetical protein HK102_010804 [Quaeritorhiza haematococci]